MGFLQVGWAELVVQGSSGCELLEQFGGQDPKSKSRRQPTQPGSTQSKYNSAATSSIIFYESYMCFL